MNDIAIVALIKSIYAKTRGFFLAENETVAQLKKKAYEAEMAKEVNKKSSTKKTSPKKTKSTTTSKASTAKKKTTTKSTGNKKVEAKNKAATSKSKTDAKSTAKKTEKVSAKSTDTKTSTTKKSTVGTKKSTATAATKTKKTTAKTSDSRSKTVATKTEKSSTVKKSVSPKVSTAKKEVTDSPKRKKSTAKTSETKKSAAGTSTKRLEKIKLYSENIEKYYGEVDTKFLEIIVKNLGPSIYKKDSELVSCSDPKELDTVRNNFLIKKLGIGAGQGVLDAAIQDVCEELKETRIKYRATFYYALAKKFKKESALS